MLSKEKYNIFKGVVGLFDTRLSATVIVTLILAVVYLFIDNRRLNTKIDEDKDKMYNLVIAEVRKQVKPIQESADSTQAIAKKNSVKVDTVTAAVLDLVSDVKQKIKKK